MASGPGRMPEPADPSAICAIVPASSGVGGSAKRARSPSVRRQCFRVDGRAVADEERRGRHAAQQRGRWFDSRRIDLASGARSERRILLRATHRPRWQPREPRRLSVPARRMPTRRRAASRRERQSLHRRDADSEPGKRAWAGGDGVDIDLAQIDVRLCRAASSDRAAAGCHAVDPIASRFAHARRRARHSCRRASSCRGRGRTLRDNTVVHTSRFSLPGSCSCSRVET